MIPESDKGKFTLEDRINRVINTDSFESTLKKSNFSLIDFQLRWRYSGGDFDFLIKPFKEAILAGEKELTQEGIVNL